MVINRQSHGPLLGCACVTSLYVAYIGMISCIVSITWHSQYVDLMLVKCEPPTACVAGQTFNHHWYNVLRILRHPLLTLVLYVLQP